MKNYLNYQSTEYDCGPVSLMNGIRYLFDREDIYPDVPKFIMLYCMDMYNENGEFCKSGTSHSVMEFLSNWLNHFSKIKCFPIACECLKDKEVILSPKSKIVRELKKGSAVVLYLHLDVWHYVLLTGIENNKAFIFDPYFEDEESYPLDPEYISDKIQFVFDQPKKYNRIVDIDRLEQTNLDYYAMGPVKNRLAVIMKRIS